MIRDIFLYGAAARLHGSHFRLDVASPAEAIRALITLRPGLRNVIRQGNWRVVVGPPRLKYSIDVDQLNMHLGEQPLHLVPATRPEGGGKGKAVGMIIVGVLLVGAAIAFPASLAAAGAVVGITAAGSAVTSVAMMGISMVLGGLSAVLAAPPTSDAATDRAAPEDRPSFLFNGVVNNSQQGAPVPLIFGTHLVGSIVINSGLNSEDIPTGEPVQPAVPPWFGKFGSGTPT